MKKTKDPTLEGTFGAIRPVLDFLPSPDELVFKGPATEKVTLVLTKDTVEFFRQKGEQFNAPYQRMIRNLLDAYVAEQPS